MSEMVKIAVIGATGAVGRIMLSELEHFGIPARVGMFASERSAGIPLKFRGEELKVQPFDIDQFSGYDFALMSAGGTFSKANAKAIAGKRCVVIDNSSAWRMDPEVPLIVPEVNGHVLKNFRNGVIANPNCSTIQMVVALKPLQEAFGLKMVNVATYQSVSGTGQKGIEELKQQMAAAAKGQFAEAKTYAKPILGNLIPAIDVMREGGHCFEEEKMVQETRKIMALPHLPVLATTVRVPVFHCHSEAITVQIGKRVSRTDILNCLSEAEGLQVIADDNYDLFPYPLQVATKRDVWIGRVRLPLGETQSDVVQFWNVADNLYKGAATNAVQILRQLI